MSLWTLCGLGCEEHLTPFGGSSRPEDSQHEVHQGIQNLNLFLLINLMKLLKVK